MGSAQRSLSFSLAPLRDIVINPARAYDQVFAVPAWGPAFLFVLICASLDLRLSAPAILHVLTHGTATHADSAAHPVTAAVRNGFFFNGALLVVTQSLVTWSMTAIVASAAARFKGLTVPYRTFFALGAVCSVPSAVGGVLDGVAVALRPSASYANLKALAVAMPDNLAIFASPGNSHEVAFLSSFGLFDVWSNILLAYGLVAFAKLRLTTALGIAFGLDIALAMLFGA